MNLTGWIAHLIPSFMATALSRIQMGTQRGRNHASIHLDVLTIWALGDFAVTACKAGLLGKLPSPLLSLYCTHSTK